jgi:hypothetical protein
MCTHGEHVIVHATAPGHVARDRDFDCQRDESIELALVPEGKTETKPAAAPPAWTPPPPKPKPGAAPPPTPSAPPPATAAAPPPVTAAPPPPKPANEVNPSGGSRPNRPIDTSSPYAH